MTDATPITPAMLTTNYGLGVRDTVKTIHHGAEHHEKAAAAVRENANIMLYAHTALCLAIGGGAYLCGGKLNQWADEHRAQALQDPITYVTAKNYCQDDPWQLRDLWTKRASPAIRQRECEDRKVQSIADLAAGDYGIHAKGAYIVAGVFLGGTPLIIGLGLALHIQARRCRKQAASFRATAQYALNSLHQAQTKMRQTETQGTLEVVGGCVPMLPSPAQVI